VREQGFFAWLKSLFGFGVLQPDALVYLPGQVS
jgi:hypothetical protein